MVGCFPIAVIQCKPVPLTRQARFEVQLSASSVTPSSVSASGGTANRRNRYTRTIRRGRYAVKPHKHRLQRHRVRLCRQPPSLAFARGYRIDHRQQLPCALMVAQQRESHRRPDRGVRVLAAVLAHARHIAFYITGIQGRLIKGRIEKLNQSRVAPDEMLIHRLHGLALALPERRRRTIPTSSAQSNRSGIRDCCGNRAANHHRNRRGDTSCHPSACCSIFRPQQIRFLFAALGKGRIPMSFGQLGKLDEDVIQKKGQPDAFATSMEAHQVHAVVPVAGTHQRQDRVRRIAGHARWRARNARYKVATLFGMNRQVVVRFLIGGDRPAFQKGNRSHPAHRYRRWWQHNGRPPKAARDSHRNSACARRGLLADATNAGHLLR